MGTKSTTLGVGGTDALTTTDPAALRAQIAETRNEMSGTIEELHGRLNPTVLKEQALEQFHEAAATVKAELKAHFAEAKEAMRVEFNEAKTAIKTEVAHEIDSVKRKFTEEVSHAKSAMREATIGKVEHMVHGAQDRAREVRTSVTETIAENPIPAALAGIGLAWLFIESRRRRASSDDRYSRRRMVSDYDAGEYRGYAYGADYGGVDYNVEDDAGDERGAMDRARDVASRTGRRIAGAAQGAASTVGGIAHDARDTAVDAASRARDSVTEVAQRARHAVGGAAHRAQATAADLRRGAGAQARQIGRRGSELYRTNPLAVGAAVLAAGTVVGLALPHTQVEDEWLGSARDQVVDKAQELAHVAIEKANEAVENVGADNGQRGGDYLASGGRPPNGTTNRTI